MPAISTLIATAGLAIAGVGAYEGYEASKQNNQAQQAAIAAQEKAEELRKQQMELDATRRTREIIRQSTAARSAALAITTAQGAAYEGGSAVPGAYGSIAGRTGVNELGVSQNLEIGEGMFAAHMDQLGAYRRAADAQSQMAMWAGIGSLGNSLISNSTTIGKIGDYGVGKVSSAVAPKGGYTGWTSSSNWA